MKEENKKQSFLERASDLSDMDSLDWVIFIIMIVLAFLMIYLFPGFFGVLLGVVIVIIGSLILTFLESREQKCRIEVKSE